MTLRNVMNCMYESEFVRIEYPIGFGCYAHKDFYDKDSIRASIESDTDFGYNDMVRDLWVGDDGAFTITLKDFGTVR